MRATNLVIGSAMLAVIGAALAGVLVARNVRGAHNQDQLRIVFMARPADAGGSPG
jgi:hypothetical protein